MTRFQWTASHPGVMCTAQMGIEILLKRNRDEVGGIREVGGPRMSWRKNEE